MSNFGFIAITFLLAALALAQGGKLNIQKFLKNIANDEDPSKKYVCGLPVYDPFEHHPSANIGKVRPNSWPWHASIRYRSQHRCSGAVISRHYVLTSAHCFRSLSIDPTDFEVWLGKHRRDDMEIGREQTIPVDDIIFHPDHAIKSVYDADIALVKLESPGAWVNTNFTLPICVEKPRRKVKPHNSQLQTTTCYVTGYRMFANYRRPVSELKQAEVPVIMPDRCLRFNRNLKPYLTDSVICTDRAQPDACHTADTGSPLVCKNSQSMTWWLVGIASSGMECSVKRDSPVVFARTSSFVKWIKENADDIDNVVFP